MNIFIDKNSGVPLYRQIIDFIQTGVRKGSIADGESLPSLNELAAQCGISMETAKKAYFVMKKSGLIKGRQGKGYTIDARDESSPTRIFLLLDKLSAYKLAIHQGLIEKLEKKADITIHVYNQDLDSFRKMIAEAAGEYDYYIVAPHFKLSVSESVIAKALRKFPNERLILIDRNIPEVMGHIGRIYQDFTGDAAAAIRSGMERIRKYSNVVIVHSEKSLYAEIITPSICGMLSNEGIVWSITKGFKASTLKPGTLYIVLGGQLDTDHFSILRKASEKGYILGETVGLISFNDEPVNEFICGGLSSLSSDFTAMGSAAAEMINSKKMKDIHNPFSLVARNSF